MKRCPRCYKTYTDDDLNFCLEDGELLVNLGDDTIQTTFGNESPRFTDDAPPTIILDTPRVTNQTTWRPSEPITPWQSQSPNIQDQPYGTPAFIHSRDQTLPTISLVLGILGIMLMCCYGGIPLGAAALITGFIGMRNADSDRTRYGGRGLAVAGMVLGIIGLLGALVFLFLGFLGSIG